MVQRGPIRTDRKIHPCSGASPSHIVPLRVNGPSSGRVHSALLPHERLTVAWGSEIRTASGRPDDRSPRVFHIPDAQRRDCSLAFAVLRGRQCAPLHPISLWKSAVLPLLGVATSVVSLKRLCSTASSANTWRPFSSKPKIGIPAVNCLASFAPSLSATCAADSSATASPASAVRLATISSPTQEQSSRPLPGPWCRNSGCFSYPLTELPGYTASLPRNPAILLFI